MMPGLGLCANYSLKRTVVGRLRQTVRYRGSYRLTVVFGAHD